MTTRLAARLLVLTAGLAFAATAAAEPTVRPDKPKDISEIMKKGHGKKGYLGAAKEALKAEKWDEVKKAGEMMKVYGETIGEFDPPKGDKAAWKTVTGKYKEATADLYKAADKKDAAGAEKALKTLGGSCKSCHDAHK